jgi:hypothetical protein
MNHMFRALVCYRPNYISYGLVNINHQAAHNSLPNERKMEPDAFLKVSALIFNQIINRFSVLG